MPVVANPPAPAQILTAKSVPVVQKSHLVENHGFCSVNITSK